MKINWKILFFISLIILVLSNLFWIYQVADTAIGHTYYKDSCEKCFADSNEFQRVLLSIGNKDDVVKFLEQYGFKYNGFSKGESFIIQFESFDLEFNRNGEILINDY